MKIYQKLRLVIKNKKPYGIRDTDGFLVLFPSISSYTDQAERFKKEVDEQYNLAYYLMRCLNKKKVSE